MEYNVDYNFDDAIKLLENNIERFKKYKEKYSRERKIKITSEIDNFCVFMRRYIFI